MKTSFHNLPKGRFARGLCFLLCCCLLMGAFAAPARAEKKSVIPSLLRFTQYAPEREYIHNDVYIARTYPKTANSQVNAEMAALIDAMVARGKPLLPGKKGELPVYLDVGAYIFRTGQKYMSFLTIGRIAQDREQTYVDFDARAYDMETGARLTMGDIFPEDSPAWEILENEVRAQLTAYYPFLTPDPAALDALCQREALESEPFTLTPAKLSLHYRADALYPGRNTLMHVNLYYREIKSYMTEAAQQQTDNSGYKLVALTYDDGGARGASNNTMEQLRLYGANATFFVIGTNIYSNHDVLCREQDAGFSLQSHNYEHVYTNLTPERILAWKKDFISKLSAVTGTVPTYMRAPGGIEGPYIRAEVGYPLIHWNVLSDDSGNDDVNAVVNNLRNRIKEGGVVLMHDLNPNCFLYTQIILPELEERGYLCVTVDELFSLYGVELLPNQVYSGCSDLTLLPLP